MVIDSALYSPVWLYMGKMEIGPYCVWGTLAENICQSYGSMPVYMATIFQLATTDMFLGEHKSRTQSKARKPRS